MSERLLGLDADTDDANEPHQCRIDGPGLTIIDPTGAPLPVAEYASVRALREQRLVEEMEMGIVKSGGQTTWLSVTAMPIPLADYGVVIVYRDITNRREAEQALRRSEERYALAVAGANDGLWDWDITTDTMYISPRGNVILGLPVTTGVSSAMWRDRVHLDDWPGVEAQLQAHLSGVTPHFHSEHRMVHVDGQTRWMLTRGLCVFDSVGRPLRMAGSLTDITYQKQTEYVLREAKAQAEAANIAKSAFLATMSHELRTPLNAILGYSELLMDNGHLPENDEVRTGIQRIYRAGSHLRALIDDVLDLSKVEADRMELHLEPFLLGQVLDSIVSTVEPLVRQNDNVLRVVCDEKLGIMHADQTKVRQIVLNVLGNAAKFTTAGVITLTCERLERDGREVVCFVIADTGIGMTVEQLTRLFQPFVQAEAATTRRYGGTGLGLALSQRLCRLMGGEITVESREGVGTTCTIELPVMVEKGYLAGRSLP
jgi:PAS domain S-box-containing protein